MKLLLLLVLVSFNSFSSCYQAVDLRKSQAEILSGLPILDQGADGYCYAYAGKFLYDYQRYLKLSKNKSSSLSLGKTSPAWAAALGMKEGSDFSDDGGKSCDVVNGLSSKMKNCVQTSLQDHAFHDLGPQIYRFLFDQDSLVTQYQGPASSMWGQFPALTAAEFQSTHLTGDKLRMRDGFVNFQRKIRNALAGRSINSAFAASPFHYYMMVKKSHFSSTYMHLPAAFALSVVEKSCTNWDSAVKSTCKEYPAYSLEPVDQALNNGNPVGISYCSRFLTDNTYRGFPQSTPQADCGMHASVIIGRKQDSRGTCQYLIRNSWGVNKVKYGWKSDQGDIWVDMDALNDNILQYQLVN